MAGMNDQGPVAAAAAPPAAPGAEQGGITLHITFPQSPDGMKAAGVLGVMAKKLGAQVAADNPQAQGAVQGGAQQQMGAFGNRPPSLSGPGAAPQGLVP